MRWLGVCCACGCGPYTAQAPAADAQLSEIRNDSLVLRASTIVRNEPIKIVRTQITVLNALDRAVTLFVTGGCPVTIQILASPPPSGRPVWDSDRARSSMGCALNLVETRIPRGESRLFVREVETTEVLGDSLSSGRYYVVAHLELVPHPITLYAGEFTLSR